MQEPLILQKIADVIRTTYFNEFELVEYHRFISTQSDKNELPLIEYLIKECQEMNIIKMRKVELNDNKN